MSSNPDLGFLGSCWSRVGGRTHRRIGSLRWSRNYPGPARDADGSPCWQRLAPEQEGHGGAGPDRWQVIGFDISGGETG
ncbi:hypothetical protein Areg01_89260 [Actinoplanes regularis]|nr:hypothetical protein Areg01_89260 [Actinoplanes regularis]